MTKTIVVAMDGSPVAERALGMAAWLARELEAELHLVTTTFSADAGDEEAYLQEQAAEIGYGRVQTDVVRHRFAATGIKELVESLPDPLLCMSTRGKGGWAELLLGSVSDEVLSGVQMPVLLAGPRCAAGEPPSRSVVVAIDGSDASFAVLPTVADWAPRLGLAVLVVTAPEHGNDGLSDVRLTAAHRLVDEAAERLAALGVEAETHVLSGGDPADLISAFAAGLPAALIAIGTHGRGVVLAAPLGRVATEIVRQSGCPVLVRRIPV